MRPGYYEVTQGKFCSGSVAYNQATKLAQAFIEQGGFVIQDLRNLTSGIRNHTEIITHFRGVHKELQARLMEVFGRLADEKHRRHLTELHGHYEQDGFIEYHLRQLANPDQGYEETVIRFRMGAT